MDQATPQSVEAAADRMVEGGLLDSILGTDEQPIQEPESQEQETDEIVDDTEAVDTDETESEPETDELEETEEEAETEEGTDTDSDEEQIEIESVDSLAEALGVTTDELLDTLKITATIDGESQVVTLREAQAGYQKDADYRRKTGELAQLKREFESKAQEAYQTTEYQHQIAANVMTAAKRELMGELQNINMDELRDRDPMAWTAKRADLMERQGQLQALEQQAHLAYQQHTQQQQQQATEARQIRLAEEAEALHKLVPNFSEIKSNLDTYLSKDYGYTNEELSSVADHRIVDLARKAMLYDQSQVKAKALKPKIKKAPKTQKPAPQAKKSVTGDKLKVAKSKLRKSGDWKDAASAIENFL